VEQLRKVYASLLEVVSSERARRWEDRPSAPLSHCRGWCSGMESPYDLSHDCYDYRQGECGRRAPGRSPDTKLKAHQRRAFTGEGNWGQRLHCAQGYLAGKLSWELLYHFCLRSKDCQRHHPCSPSPRHQMVHF